MRYLSRAQERNGQSPSIRRFPSARPSSSATVRSAGAGRQRCRAWRRCRSRQKCQSSFRPGRRRGCSRPVATAGAGPAPPLCRGGLLAARSRHSCWRCGAPVRSTSWLSLLSRSSAPGLHRRSHRSTCCCPGARATRYKPASAGPRPGAQRSRDDSSWQNSNSRRRSSVFGRWSSAIGPRSLARCRGLGQRPRTEDLRLLLAVFPR